MSEAATSVEAVEGVEEWVCPKIKPKDMSICFEGFKWKHWFVRLPKGLTHATMREHPECWKLVQQTPRTSLVRYDTVTIVDYDESHIAEARVCVATPDAVHLTQFKLSSFESATTTETFSDGRFFAGWNGIGFQVTRVADGVLIGPAHATLAQAKIFINQQYPKKAK